MSRTVRAYPIKAPCSGKERFALVKATVAQLSEHFDSVVIVCTRVEGQKTERFDWGAGNRYAVEASLHEVANEINMPAFHPPEEDDDD